MKLLEQNFCENEEIEEEEVTITRSKLPFSPLQSPSSSSSSSARNGNFMLQKQDPWLPSSSDHTLNSNSSLEFTDLSLGTEIAAIGKNANSIEKEHLFDKVVTPSDVGKLNRLVIPKQHAERYFPLDPNSDERGLLLSFKDRNGKQWRFRYSYWNSSQSYVMTKGWSRFVKDKKLNAGDIVSFFRESTTHQLYIDCRCRPRAPDPTSFSQFGLQNQFPSVRWGRLYSLPPLPFSRPPYDQRSQFHRLNHDYCVQPYHHRCNFLPQTTNFPVAVSEQYFLRPQFGGLQGGRAPMVIDSVPVVRGRSAGKRLRLFGVNMESPTSGEDDQYQSSSSSSQRGNSHSGGPIATAEADSSEGKSSLSFDMDL